MKQGLERLFWVIGGVLILPFLIQQSLVLSSGAQGRTEVPQLRSAPVLRPAIATATNLKPGNERVAISNRPLPESRPLSTPEQGSLEKPDTSVWSATRVAAWEELAELIARPVGSLMFPALNVEVPVFADADEVALTLGAGIIPGTAALDGQGNIGMASHRDGHFRHLKNVSVGDLLLLKSDRGLRQFRVVDTRIVEPADTWVLDPGKKPRLTLVTCYPFQYLGSAPQRFVVSAEEVEVEFTARSPDTAFMEGNHVIGGPRYETVKF